MPSKQSLDGIELSVNLPWMLGQGSMYGGRALTGWAWAEVGVEMGGWAGTVTRSMPGR